MVNIREKINMLKKIKDNFTMRLKDLMAIDKYGEFREYYKLLDHLKLRRKKIDGMKTIRFSDESKIIEILSSINIFRRAYPKSTIGTYFLEVEYYIGDGTGYLHFDHHYFPVINVDTEYKELRIRSSSFGKIKNNEGTDLDFDEKFISILSKEIERLEAIETLDTLIYLFRNAYHKHHNLLLLKNNYHKHYICDPALFADRMENPHIRALLSLVDDFYWNIYEFSSQPMKNSCVKIRSMKESWIKIRYKDNKGSIGCNDNRCSYVYVVHYNENNDVELLEIKRSTLGSA